MPIDAHTMMQFNAGELSEKEIVEMVGEELSLTGLDDIPKDLYKLAKKYISKGYLDEDGDINYIKIKESME